jgi:hypothetical protein
MRLIVLALVLAFCVTSEAASIEGEITLPFSLADANGTALTKQSGDQVKASWSCRVSQFYGWETIFAQLTVTNTGSKTRWGQCCLAFYDKDKKLVGTAAQTFTSRRGLKPRTARKLNVCRIILPRDKYKDIVSYEAVIHEMDTPPAKNKESILLEDP